MPPTDSREGVLANLWQVRLFTFSGKETAHSVAEPGDGVSKEKGPQPLGCGPDVDNLAAGTF
jgi:hypothetical protein